MNCQKLKAIKKSGFTLNNAKLRNFILQISFLKRKKAFVGM